MSFHAIRSLLDSSQDFLALIEADGTIRECNLAFAEAVGLPIDELLGQRANQYICKKHKVVFNTRLREAFSVGSKEAVLADVNVSTRTTRPVSWQMKPQFNLEGQIEFVILVGHDTAEQGLVRRDENILPQAVTQRNKSVVSQLFESGGSSARTEEDEAGQNGKRWMTHRFAMGDLPDRQIGGLSLDITQLTEVEERFRAVAEASTDAVAILRPMRNSGGRIIDFSLNYLNRFAQHVFAVNERSEDSFKNATQSILPSTIIPSLIRVVETGIPFETEIAIVGPENSQIYIQLQAVRAGDFVGLNVRDISSERYAHRLSQLATLRFKTLFDGNPAACMTLDLDGKVVDWNRKCEEVYGYSEDEVRGKSIIELVVGVETRQKAFDASAETQRLGGNHEGSEWCVKRKDGKRIWVFSSTVPLHDNSGEVAGIISSNIDITALKEAEAALRTSNADLEQFANVASHDLLEPLRMISCYMDLLESQYGDRLDSQGHQFLRFALDGALRMREMIKSLLEFSQLGKVLTLQEKVCMDEVVQQALGNLHVAIHHEPRPHIVVEKLPEMLGSKPELVRLIQNLVANSLKFKSSEQSEIKISVIERPTGYEFSVKDNGIGIDPRFQDKVFKLFQRLHHKSDFEGCGIGLSVCRKIVEMHGGRIWIEPSNEGCEIRFNFHIDGAESVGQAA